jgi:nucleotide sugar dehydrogenase
MKIQIIGVGVIGEAQAYLATQLGHEVLGFDSAKPASQYARMVKQIEKDVDITFICTPESAVEEVVVELVQQNVKGLYVIRSSVPPKTTQRLTQKYGVHLCHNPEFLRVKTAFDDILHPHFVLIGQCCPEHGDILSKFYLSTEHPVLITQPTISETVKITLNSYLATLIAFWNEIDELTASMGVDIKEVARIARFDPRVSDYGTEFFGVAFGGTCLPKDIKQLIQACLQGGVSPQLLEAVRDSNQAIKDSNN